MVLRYKLNTFVYKKYLIVIPLILAERLLYRGAL